VKTFGRCRIAVSPTQSNPTNNRERMAKYMSRSLALSTVYRHLQPQSNAFSIPRLQSIRFEHGKQEEPKLPRPHLRRPEPHNRPKGKLVSWRTVGIFGAAASVLLGALSYIKDTKDKAIEKEQNRHLGKADIGGTWELIDTDGKPRKSEDFHGKWCIIYFGFTHCPDVCPDELEKMTGIVDDLEKQKVPIQPLFITVDPERDSNEMVGKYVKEFSPKLLGLTGSAEQIASVCKKFRVYYSAGPKDKDNDYIVDHTIIIYLINPKGEFVDYFGQTKTRVDVASAITMEIAKFDSQNQTGWFAKN